MTLTDSPDFHTAPPSSSNRQVIEWLRTLSPAPVTPPRVRMLDDLQNGSLFICTYSSGDALVFQGSPEFINRWYTWAYNTEVTPRTAQLHWWGNRCAYICADRAAILRGLTLQFEAEIVRDREIPVIVTRDPETEEVDVVWDAGRVSELAAARAAAFLRDHIAVNHVIMERPRNIAPIYGLSAPGRAEQKWAATGTEV
jgi:hypothetical protein